MLVFVAWVTFLDAVHLMARKAASKYELASKELKAVSKWAAITKSFCTQPDDDKQRSFSVDHASPVSVLAEVYF